MPSGGALDLSDEDVESLTDADLEAALAAATDSVARIRRPNLPAPAPEARREDTQLHLDVAALARELEKEELRKKKPPRGHYDLDEGPASGELDAVFDGAERRPARSLFDDDDPSLAFPVPPPARPSAAEAELAEAEHRIFDLEQRLHALADDAEVTRRDLLRSRQETREARDRADTLQAQIDVYQGRLLKQSDEFERVRRRGEKERDEASRFGIEKLLKDLLVVVDNLERAISHADEQGGGTAALVDGVRMTLGQWLAVLKKHGVQRIETESGMVFDPAVHEAMDQVRGSDVLPGCVVQVFQTGFMIHDRLLRPAMVSVSALTDDGEGEAGPGPEGVQDG